MALITGGKNTVQFDYSSTCIHCDQSVWCHTDEYPFWCISTDLRLIQQTCFETTLTIKPKMLTYYQLNDFHRDVVSLVEAEAVVKALNEYCTVSGGGASKHLSKAIRQCFDEFYDNEAELKAGVDSKVLFRLTWLVRQEADQRARAQMYSETYPFATQAEKLGLIGVTNAD